MKNFQFCFFWVLIFFQSTTFSQTIVNGNVSGIWTIANSPYVVNNNLVLQPTDTLIIHPGVEVRFDGNYRFDIFGTFFAVGTTSDSIKFTRNDSANWGSLNFADASNDSSKIQYCIIEYGSSSGYDPYHGIINCLNSSPTIANSTIGNNTHKGVYMNGSNAQPLIIDNIFQNHSGICLEVKSSAQPIIVGNELLSNNNTAIYIDYSPNVVINDNNISNNAGRGIDLGYYCNGTQITNNIIMANNNSGIYLYSQNENVSIENNTISNNNNEGINLQFNNYYATIENNTISNNTNGGIRLASQNTDFYILNNIISNNSNNGIFAVNNSYGNIIGNLIIDNEVNGIDLDWVPFGNCIVRNNTINGHTEAGFRFYSQGDPILLAINNSVSNNNIGINCNNSNNSTTITFNNCWNNSSNNYLGSLPTGIENPTNVNSNGTICDVYYNISENPQYNDVNNDDFALQPGSPNISAGNPGYTDPDGTISDIGAFYFETHLYTPDADFVGNILFGNPPLTVNFTDLSQVSNIGTPVNSWLWSFGDDSISTEQNPTHTYQQSGNNTVTLVITDSIGFSDTEIKENYINIFATEVYDLDIGGDEDLQHLLSHEPVITFDFYNSENELQTHYQAQISTDSTFATIDMWDTGEVTGSDTSIIYTGSSLVDGQMYHLRVKVSSSGFWSEWATLTFQMNTEPSTPVQVSPTNEVSGVPVVLKVLNSTDAESDAVTYSFTVYNDANLTTNLDSVTAVPEGIDTTGWQITVLLPDNGQYWWTVSANDGYEESAVSGSASFLVNSVNDEPAAFNLLSPADSSEVDTLNPLLVWESAFDPDPLDTVRYTLYFGNDIPNLQSLDVDTSTNYQIISPLMDNTTYYWKVVATDLSGATAENFGGYHSFRVNTINDLPGDFALSSPENDSMVTNLTPTFHWEVPIDPDDQRSRSITSYDLYLGFDSSFTAVEPISVDTNQYNPLDNLAEDQLYYWKVIAFDNNGGNAVSNIWSFWTNSQNSIPSHFSVISPINGVGVDTILPTFAWHPSIDDDLNDMVVYNIYLGESIEDIEPVYTGIVPWITDTTFTLIEPAIDNTTYYWNVVATDLSGATRENANGFQSFNVNLGNETPSAVDLISPDSVIVLTLIPEFHWTESFDPDPNDSIYYEVHWWKAGDNILDSVLTDTNYMQVPTPINDNSMYYWQVLTMDQSYGISHSEDAVFWTDVYPEAPLAFTTVYPEDNAEGLSSPVEFVWNQTTDPDPLSYLSYRLTYATDWTDSSAYDYALVYYDTNIVIGLEDNTEYFWTVEAIDDDQMVTTSNSGVPFRFVVGVLSIEDQAAIPNKFALHQNYPNPFNPITSIHYDLPEASNVQIVIIDLLGRQVTPLINRFEDPGFKQVIWNATNSKGQPVGAGLYFYQIHAGEFIETKKMVLLR